MQEEASEETIAANIKKVSSKSPCPPLAGRHATASELTQDHPLTALLLARFFVRHVAPILERNGSSPDALMLIIF